MADPGQFVESKVKRDTGGRFSTTDAGTATPQRRPSRVRAGASVRYGGGTYTAVGRTHDGRVVLEGDSGRFAVSPKAVNSDSGAARVPADPKVVPSFDVGDRLGDVVAQLRADGVQVWTDAFGGTSFMWGGRQMDLTGR